MYRKVLFIALASMMLIGCKGNNVESSEPKSESDPGPVATISEERYTNYYFSYDFLRNDANFSMEGRCEIPSLHQDGRVEAEVDGDLYHDRSYVGNFDEHYYELLDSATNNFKYMYWNAGGYKTTEKTISFKMLSYALFGLTFPEFSQIQYNSKTKCYETKDEIVWSLEKFSQKVELYFEEEVLVKANIYLTKQDTTEVYKTFTEEFYAFGETEVTFPE